MSSPALASTMSARGEQLLRAMRINLELLVELEKSDPGAVAIIVSALVAHLRSWKPLAATAVPVQLDAVPLALVAPGDAADAIERRIEADGAYRLSATRDQDGRYVSLLIRDEDDTACGVMSPAQTRVLMEDLGRMLATVEAGRG